MLFHTFVFQNERRKFYVGYSFGFVLCRLDGNTATEEIVSNNDVASFHYGSSFLYFYEMIWTSVVMHIGRLVSVVHMLILKNVIRIGAGVTDKCS